MNKNRKIYNKNDWAMFIYGYLRLAELACLEIVEGKYNNKANGQFKIEEIYIPAIFNLKHGIELFLKVFSIEFLDKEYLGSLFLITDSNFNGKYLV